MIDFNELIENHVMREFRKPEIGRYYPSAVGQCLRKSWYSYKQPKQLPVDKLKVFEAGNLVHEFMAHVFRSERNQHIALVEAELPLKLEIGDFLISGRLDDIILLKLNNQQYLIEVKSRGTMQYLDEAEKSHVMQLQLYMLISGIHQGFMVYIEKNTLQAKSFIVHFDATVAQEAISRFALLHSHLKQGTLPQPEARMLSSLNWLCKFCEYREDCYQATPAELLP
jgi:CRISPR/Cas system-associated exonuclease Cas4 (RecB family)